MNNGINGISVVIPAFNEEAGIASVIDQVAAALTNKYPFEIIVIDDGSTDTTAQIATQKGARVLSHPINMGYGFSLKDGIRAATYECVLMTDADMTYSTDALPSMLADYERGVDMVVGARRGASYNPTFTKRIARLVFKLMSEFVVGKKIPDINSGFRLVRRSKILPVLPDLSNAFSFSTSSTLIFFLKHHYVSYVPVDYHVRTGTSKVRYLRDSLRALQIMTEIIAMYNPIKLFILLAFLPAVVSVVTLLMWVTGIRVGSLEVLVSVYSTIIILALGFIAVSFKRRSDV